jgi:hypothetical protein
MVDRIFGRNEAIQGYADRKATEWTKLENILLTVNGGTLGISVTLFTNHGGSFQHPRILEWAWTFLAVGLVCLMLSYAFSEAFHELLLRKLQKAPDTFPESQLNAMKSKWTVTGMYVTNYAALGLTILGMILLVIFGIYNIG